MKVLVTGGSGFIGRYVIDELRIDNHYVKSMDTTKPKSTPYFTMPDVHVDGSVLDRVKINSLVKGVDAVMNLAGILGTSETLENTIDPVKVNIIGALNVFDACKKHKKKCCTITVGNHFMNNTYAITKTASERFALMYNKEFDTKITVVRGLNAYGPGQKHAPVRKVIPNFIIPMLKNQPVIVFGDGSQIMDFIYVKDLADVLVRALLDEHGHWDRIIEAGSGRDTSINSIADKIKFLTGSKSEITHQPMRPGEIPRSTVLADIDTLRCLGIEAATFTKLDTGLIKTIEYYRQNLRHYG